MALMGSSTVVTVAASGAAYHGATCYIETGYQAINAGATVVPFDAAWDDTDGYFSAADHGFKIPSGLAGRYRVNYTIAGDQAGSSAVAAVSSGLLVGTVDPNNAYYAYMTKGAFIDNNGIGASGSAVMTLAEGDIVTTVCGQGGVAHTYRTNFPGDGYVFTMPLGGTFMQIEKVG
jgi:hypothetical protein